MLKSQWYLKLGGKQIGPITSSQLKQLLEDPQYQQEAFVLKDGWESWHRAVDLIAYLRGQNNFSNDTNTVSTLAIQGADWYVYIDQKQLGPYSLERVNALIEGRSYKEAVYLFHRSWKEWRHLREIPESVLSGETPMQSTVETEASERRIGGERAPVGGAVIVHNDQVVSVVDAQNISKSGMFITSSEHVFYAGEVVKLTIKCPVLAAPFHTKAEVVRYGTDQKGNNGYALKFVELGGLLERHIGRYVKSYNQSSAKNYSIASVG